MAVLGILAVVKDFLKAYQASTYVNFFPCLPIPHPFPIKEYFPTQLNLRNVLL